MVRRLVHIANAGGARFLSFVQFFSLIHFPANIPHTHYRTARIAQVTPPVDIKNSVLYNLPFHTSADGSPKQDRQHIMDSAGRMLLWQTML